MKKSLTLTAATITAFALLACASLDQSAGPTISLLPAGVTTEQASSLFVPAAFDLVSLDTRFMGWSKAPKPDAVVNGIDGPLSRTLLLSPGPHAITFKPAVWGNFRSHGGEWLLTHRFEPGKKYRITASISGSTASANLQVSGADGKWTPIKLIPADPNERVGNSSLFDAFNQLKTGR